MLSANLGAAPYPSSIVGTADAANVSANYKPNHTHCNTVKNIKRKHAKFMALRFNVHSHVK